MIALWLSLNCRDHPRDQKSVTGVACHAGGAAVADVLPLRESGSRPASTQADGAGGQVTTSAPDAAAALEKDAANRKEATTTRRTSVGFG